MMGMDTNHEHIHTKVGTRLWHVNMSMMEREDQRQP